MADNGEAYKYIALVLIAVLSGLLFIRRRKRLQRRLRLLAITRRRRIEASVLERLQSKRRAVIGRRRKTAWVLERPQFWFEHMVLNQYENNIWREHFRISRQTFCVLSNLVASHLVRQDTNIWQAIPVEKRGAVLL